jgi:hypothetical protein
MNSLLIGGGSERSTTLHELQHAIQQREGFARGGSPELMRDKYMDFADPQTIEYAKSLPMYSRQPTEEAKQEFIRSFVQMKLGTPVEAYGRLAGEAEARLTQSRMDMTGPERAASYPPDMYDVPVEDQIVRYGEGPALATTWHGSPHLFPPTELNDLGEFNAAKINTGEGAQAYSYGHYTGEARGTGEGYQNAGYGGFMLDGEVVHPTTTKGAKEYAAAALSRFPDKKEAMAWVGDSSMAKEVNAIIRKTKDFGENKGHLYKVDIPDEHIAKMLDWDKPLRQQPEEIRKILEKAAPLVKTVDTMSREELINTLQYIDRNGSYTDEMMINEFGRPATLDELRETAKMMDVDEYLAENMASDKHATGQSVYKQLVAKFGGGENQSTAAGQVKASELLQKAGIPGVRYLDAGSRGAGEGTSNFVVFPGNEHMMTILERNGQAMSPESQAIARYREIKGPKSVVRMEAALRTAGVPLPKNEPVAYIQKLVDLAHRRN